MEFEQIRDNGKLTIKIAGRIDADNADKLEQGVLDSLDGVNDLTFDMKDVEYVASAGLRVILVAKKAILFFIMYNIPTNKRKSKSTASISRNGAFVIGIRSKLLLRILRRRNRCSSNTRLERQNKKDTFLERYWGELNPCITQLYFEIYCFSFNSSK